MDCRSSKVRLIRPFVIAWIVCLVVGATALSEEPAARWWKGNLHTHSLWSDGDQFPEMIAHWYREHGYHFLALTDHNVLSEGERWMSYAQIVKRSDDGILQRYRDRFGDTWVETRGEIAEQSQPIDDTTDGTSLVPKSEIDAKGERSAETIDGNVEGRRRHDFEVRLKPLDEFRYLLEERERFILIPAEEISDRAAGKPVHINATNLAEVLAPVGGETVREAMQNNLRAILEHEKRHGREVLPHLNHPNFHYAVTAEDLAAVTSERFFEVYNGHPGVNHLGDKSHPSVERIWDLVNAIRQTGVDVPPMMGIATDDSHEYHGKPGSRPGRGWVMVRSRFLTPEHLIRAMKRGDFYASSGVTLIDVRFDESTRTLHVEIEPSGIANFETTFISTHAQNGRELSEGNHDVDDHGTRNHNPLRADTTIEQSRPEIADRLAATSDEPSESKDDEPDIDNGSEEIEPRIGKVMSSVKGLVASYQMSDDDLYVRAVITSDVDHPDPSFDGQKQQAWTQPVGWKSIEPLEPNQVAP